MGTRRGSGHNWRDDEETLSVHPGGCRGRSGLRLVAVLLQQPGSESLQRRKRRAAFWIGKPVALAGAHPGAWQGFDDVAATQFVLDRKPRRNRYAEAGDRGLDGHLVVLKARAAFAVDAGDVL